MIDSLRGLRTDLATQERIIREKWTRSPYKTFRDRDARYKHYVRIRGMIKGVGDWKCHRALYSVSCHCRRRRNVNSFFVRSLMLDLDLELHLLAPWLLRILLTSSCLGFSEDMACQSLFLLTEKPLSRDSLLPFADYLVEVHSFSPSDRLQTERSNRALEGMLRHYVSTSQNDWDLKLPCAGFAVSNSLKAATGFTAVYLNHGQNSRSPASVAKNTSMPSAKEFDEKLNMAISRARDCFKTAQAHMKRKADVHRRDSNLFIGDDVLLSSKNIRLKANGTKSAAYIHRSFQDT